MKVLVIGAGVLGASVARELAQRGVHVHVIEQHSSPSAGVSGSSFGWVGLIHSDPVESPEAYRLRVEAAAEFARLSASFNNPSWYRRVGSILWHEDPHDTQRLVDRHQHANSNIYSITSAEAHELEPAIIEPPECAAYSPNDCAIDVEIMVRSLLHDAQARGASVTFGERVLQVEPHNEHHTTVTTTAGKYQADIVVLANALDAFDLLKPLGTQLPLEASPAVLLRLKTSQHLVNGIVNSPVIEVRQNPDRMLWIAQDPEPSGDDRNLIEPVKQHLAGLFGSVPDLDVVSVTRGIRPLPHGDIPIVGFVPNLPGVYILIAHPGVMLAPFLSRAAAEEIVHGRRTPLVGNWTSEGTSA
jgi:glycine/D-amino acid oxidase-like deaminating enzyme